MSRYYKIGTVTVPRETKVMKVPFQLRGRYRNNMHICDKCFGNTKEEAIDQLTSRRRSLGRKTVPIKAREKM